MMKLKRLARDFPVPLIFTLAVFSGVAFAQVQEAPQTALADPTVVAAGEAVFKNRCALCHAEGAFGAPLPDVLKTFEHARVVDALTIGKMVENAEGLTLNEIHAVATFVTGKPAISHSDVSEPDPAPNGSAQPSAAPL